MSTATTGQTVTKMDFLTTIWPPADHGFYVTSELSKADEDWTDKVHDSIEDAVNYLTKKAKTHNVFHAIGTFRERQVMVWSKKEQKEVPSKRHHSNAAYFKTLMLDLDVGTDKPYKTQDEAITAIRSFIEAIDLPSPMLVSSGYGVHAYIVFDKPIDSDIWVVIAQKLKQLTQHHGLHADPTCTADKARVLRPAGAFNYKHGGKQEVKVLEALKQTTPAAEIEKIIDSAMAEASIKLNVSTKRDYEGIKDATADMELIYSRCQRLQHYREAGGPIGYPPRCSWVSVMKCCKNPSYDDLLKNDKDPDTVAYQTENILITSISDNPHTCTKFAEVKPELCDGCQHKDKIKSPVVLGYPDKVHFQDDRYKITDDGFFVGADDSWYRIASCMIPMAKAANPNSLGWGFIVKILDSRNNLKQVFIPNAMLNSRPSEAIGLLSDAGLLIYASKNDSVINALKQWNYPEKDYTTTSQTGWHDGAFVLPDRVIGGDNSYFNTSGSVSPLTESGTSEEWREQISELIENCYAAVFSTSMAFAGPCFHFVADSTGGVNLYGDTTAGKSTSAFCGATVYGKGGIKGGYTQLWSTTANSIENTAANHTDLLLILDEMGQAQPHEIQKIIYALDQGKGKARMNADTTQKQSKAWRTPVLSTGEKSVRLFAKEAGQKQMGGTMVRMTDVPVDKLGDLFDGRPSQFENSVDFARYLESAVVKYYGTVGREWLEYIARDQGKFRRSFKKLAERIEKFLAKDITDGQVLRVARRFSTIAAAGEVASMEGFTGWKQGSAINATKALFDAWHDESGAKAGKTHEQRSVVDHVLLFLQTNRANFHETTGFSLSNTKAMGYLWKPDSKAKPPLSTDTNYFVFSTQQFREFVCGDYTEATVIKALDEAKVLVKKEHSVKIHGTATKCRILILPDETSETAGGQVTGNNEEVT